MVDQQKAQADLRKLLAEPRQARRQPDCAEGGGRSDTQQA